MLSCISIVCARTYVWLREHERGAKGVSACVSGSWLVNSEFPWPVKQ